jgi:copper homeostasis protein
LTKILVEAAVETLAEAVAAEEAGARRIELCADLAQDGLTPAPALVASVMTRLRVPVFMMVRPRDGGFVYADDEFDVMLREVHGAARSGLAGVVTGVLSPDGSVDARRTRALVEAAAPLPVTFHRAFDRVADKPGALEALIDAGVARVLTSGGAPTALEGAETLAALVREAGDRIAILAAGGVRAHNVRDLVTRTGVREVHSRFVGATAMELLVDAVSGVRAGADRQGLL